MNQLVHTQIHSRRKALTLFGTIFVDGAKIYKVCMLNSCAHYPNHAADLNILFVRYCLMSIHKHMSIQQNHKNIFT